jgi:hypothetical protein
MRLIQYNKHNYLNYIYNKIDLDKQENFILYQSDQFTCLSRTIFIVDII